MGVSLGYLATKHENRGWNTILLTHNPVHFLLHQPTSYYLFFHHPSLNEEVHMSYVVSISKLTKKICTDIPLNKLLDIMGHLISYKITVINEVM